MAAPMEIGTRITPVFPVGGMEWEMRKKVVSGTRTCAVGALLKNCTAKAESGGGCFESGDKCSEYEKQARAELCWRIIRWVWEDQERCG